MKAKYIPNIITALRLILVFPFLIFLLKSHFEFAFYIFLIAGFSDGIDGFLARHFHWTSYFGAVMDPIADKLLMMGSFYALAWLAILPLWLCVIVILRDVVIMSGVGGVYYARGHINFEPTLISKINTGFQVALISLTLFSMAFWPLPQNLILVIMGVVSVTTVLSLVGYVWVGIQHVFFDSP